MVGAITFAAALTALSVSAVWVTRYLQLRQAATMVPVELHVGERHSLPVWSLQELNQASIMVTCTCMHHECKHGVGCYWSRLQYPWTRQVHHMLDAERRPVRRRTRPLPVLECDEAEDGKSRDCPICLEEVTSNVGWTKFSCTHGTCSGAASATTQPVCCSCDGVMPVAVSCTWRSKAVALLSALWGCTCRRGISVATSCISAAVVLVQCATESSARGLSKVQHVPCAAPCWWRRSRLSQRQRLRQLLQVRSQHQKLQLSSRTKQMLHRPPRLVSSCPMHAQTWARVAHVVHGSWQARQPLSQAFAWRWLLAGSTLSGMLADADADADTVNCGCAGNVLQDEDRQDSSQPLTSAMVSHEPSAVTSSSRDCSAEYRRG